MIAYILIIFGFLMRLVPHMPNFVPIAAIALFAGTYLDKRIVPWVPLAIMIVSDLIIGLHGVVFYTWGAFIVIGFMGLWLKENRTPGNIIAASLISAIFFFVVTNFGVWLAWYPHTWEGFAACYVKAIPFSGIPWRGICFSRSCFSVLMNLQGSLLAERNTALFF